MYTFFIFWTCFPLNCAEKSCIHFRYNVGANERIIRDCAWFGWYKFFFYVRIKQKAVCVKYDLRFAEISLFAGTGTCDPQHILHHFRYKHSQTLVHQFRRLVSHNKDYRGCYCLTHGKSLLYYIRHSSL